MKQALESITEPDGYILHSPFTLCSTFLAVFHWQGQAIMHEMMSPHQHGLKLSVEREEGIQQRKPTASSKPPSPFFLNKLYFTVIANKTISGILCSPFK